MKKITIVGGGSAGWISAFLISKLRKDFQIDLIESSEFLPVGVGEGTTGKFLEIFYRYNLDVNYTELLKETKGLPKLGINFVNWSDGKDFISPIMSPAISNTDTDYASYYYKLLNKDLCECNETAYLSKIGYTNLMLDEQGNLSFNEYLPGVHVDAGFLLDFFKNKSISNGVNHIVDTVEKVEKRNNNIVKICLKNNKDYYSDFYIDCTGFSRKLLNDVEWIDYSDYLPIDRGLPFKIKNDNREKKAYTNAIAMDNGWVWEIPTQYKIGRGYCFSSKYSDEETCIKELENYYKTEVEKIKLIEFSSGRLSKFLVGNCLALGLSAAFFEPLQATSLHCTLFQLEEFISSFLNHGDINLDKISIDNYNEKYSKMYDDMKDFIFLHYTGGKTNTDFWKHFTKIDYPQRVGKIIYLNNVRLLRGYDIENYNGQAGMHLIVPTLLGLNHFNKETAKKVLSSHLDFENMNIFMEDFFKNLNDKIQYKKYLSIEQLTNYKY